MAVRLDIKPAHPDNHPDFSLIHQTMHRADVRALHIEHMYRLDAHPPPSLQQPTARSPVTSLKLTTAGAPSTALADILSWPAALRTLHIECSIDHAGRMVRYAAGATPFSTAGVMAALAPQRMNLQHFYYRASYEETEAHIRDGVADFRAFTALRTLDVPLDLLWGESWGEDDGEDDADWAPPPLADVLPDSVEEVVLDVAGSGHGFYWLAEADELHQSKAAAELFAWLEGVPRARASGRLAGLRSVRINTEDWDPPRGPLDCAETRAVRAAFEGAGVALSWAHQG